MPLKDGHAVAAARQLDRRGDAGRPRADDGDFVQLHPGARRHVHAVEIHVRDVVFDAGKVHGRVLAAADAVPGALFFVIAYQRTDSGKRVVFKEDLPRLHQPVLLEQLDDLRDRCMHGTALLTLRIFAVVAAVGLGDDVQGHVSVAS